MNSSVHALPVLRDNIVWILIRGQHAVVVDPATAAPVRDWLQERGLELRAVLQTHHHPDHIGGTEELLATWPKACLLYTSPSPRDGLLSRMPSSA